MGETKTEKFDSIINGREYKTIIWLNNQGNPIAYKDQPKIINPNVSVSGAHCFRDFPEQNHYDIFSGGQLIKEYCNGPFPMNFSGALLII